MSLADYLVARITAAIDPCPLDDGIAEPAPLHATFYADEPLRAAGDVAHTSNLLTGRFQLTYTGEGTKAAREYVQWLQRKARAALIDHVPAVTGFQFGPIEIETTLPARADASAADSAMFAIDTFVVRGATA